MISEWFQTTVEWQNWGLNALTFSSLATVFFCVLQLWTLAGQRRKILNNKSGESLSLPLFAYLGGAMLSFSVYGYFRSSLAIIFNGSQGVLYTAILILLWRLNKPRGWQRLTPLFYLYIPLMFIPSIRDPVLFIQMAFSLLPLLHQLHEIFKNKKAGSVDVRFSLAYGTSATFWSIYGFTIGNKPLYVLNPIMALVMFSISIMYFVYKRRERLSTGN